MKSFSLPDPAQRPALLRTALAALVIVFCAHAFSFFNLTYSGPSVMLNAQKSFYGQIESGQYLQAIYFSIRGGAASPMLVGMIGTAGLCLCMLLLSDLLGLQTSPLRFSLCAALCAHPAVTALFASSIHAADAVLLALPTVCGALWLCRRLRFGFIPAAALLAAAFALSEDAPAFAAGLLLVLLCGALLDGEAARAIAAFASKALLALLAACALYAAGHAVLLRAAGLDATAVLQLPASPAQLWLEPVSALFAPFTAYPKLNVCLRLLLPAAALICAWPSLRRAGGTRALLIAFCALALPLAVNLPAYSRAPAAQVRLSYLLPDALILLFAARADTSRLQRAARAFIRGAFGLLLVGSVIFSNQVYLKKSLEFESTLSTMTRIVDRLEDTQGYVPGSTPVAIIGTPQSAVRTLDGFEHLTVLDAAAAPSAVTTGEEMTGYLWEILGYPCNLISDFERDQLAQSEAVRAMPVYPAQGCCAFAGDVLVIKLEEPVIPSE